MNNQEINTRLDILLNVLMYCSSKQMEGKAPIFTLSERICINQERGSLFTQLSPSESDEFDSEIRHSQVPDTIESKIQFTLKKMKTDNWVNYDQSSFLITSEY
jgi:hypothetical protein